MWPQNFSPVAEQAFEHSWAAKAATQRAWDTRQPSEHARASAIHLAAAAAHRVAAQALGTQVAGSRQAKQLEEHQSRMAQHVSDAAFHRQESQKQLPGNPNLTYGSKPRAKLGYGPGAPPG